MAEGVGGGRRSLCGASGRAEVYVLDSSPRRRCQSARELLHTTLTTAGYDVVDAATMADSDSRRFGSRRTDLVITDLYMPERDGLEVIEALWRSHRGVKVLAISGASGTMGYFPLAQALAP